MTLTGTAQQWNLIGLLCIGMLQGMGFPQDSGAQNSSENIQNPRAIAETLGPDYSNPIYWFTQIEAWRKAVEGHHPGMADRAAVNIAAWDRTELEVVIGMTKGLFKLSYDALIGLPALGNRKISAYLGITEDKDKETILKKGALLHADIAILELENAPQDRSGARQARILEAVQKLKQIKETEGNREKSLQILIKVMSDPYKESNSEMAWIKDGRSLPVDEGRHMEYGRLLLDSVKPDPSQDALVRQWYLATSAYGLSCGRTTYIEKHLKHAQDVFGSDAAILFLAGLLHEEYAAPRYQNALQQSGSKLRADSRQRELDLARALFQRATEADRNFAEARLRFGRVIGLLGDHARAVSEMEKASAGIQDPPLQYCAALFIGREMVMLRRSAEALEQFRRAAELYPEAQSPLLAESQLAYSMGDPANALKALERAFAVAERRPRSEDPRFAYGLVPAARAAALLKEMRSAFGDLWR